MSSAKATLVEPDVVAFEVKYRFSQGKPTQHYSCDITFPGTKNHGTRLLENWELKTEGVIRDKITLMAPGVTTFEIRMAETASPQVPFKKISNVVTGKVEPGGTP